MVKLANAKKRTKRAWRTARVRNGAAGRLANMIGSLFGVAPILAGTALLLVGNGLFSTFIALRMSMEGFASGSIGLVVASYSVGFLIGCRFAGRLVRQVGHIRAFAILAGVMCAVVLLYPFLIGTISWTLLRALNGAAAAGMFMITESWLNHRTAADERGRVLAVYTISNKLAFGGGQFLLGLADPAGQLLFMAAAIAYTLSLVPVALTAKAAPPIEDGPRMGIRALYRASPLGVVGVLLAGLVVSAISGMAPVFAQRIGMSTVEIGHFIAVLTVGGLILMWPIGWLSDRFDRRIVLIVTVIAMTLSAIGLAVAWSWSMLSLYVLIALFGGLSGAVYPICVTHTNDFIDRSQVVSVSGSMLLLWSVGATAGPLIASPLMDAFGPSALFWLAAGVSLALAVFVAYRRRMRVGRPVQEQSPFVAEAAITPIASTLDPRAEPRSDRN
jgi:MFS family permease